MQGREVQVEVQGEVARQPAAGRCRYIVQTQGDSPGGDRSYSDSAEVVTSRAAGVLVVILLRWTVIYSALH